MTTHELVALIKKNPIVVVCGVLSLGLVGAIYFRSDAIEAANQTLDAKSTESRRYALNLTNAVQLKEQLDAIVAANKVIDGRMIRASDIGINQAYFYKLESESGVKLTELHQGGRGALPPGAAYVPVGFAVSFSGDFASIMKFMRLLEDGTHYCRVLTASCNGGRKGPLAVTLTLEILARP